MADVVLTGDPKCGQIRIVKAIKVDSIDSNANYTFSIAQHCEQCSRLLNKDVSLITSSATFNYIDEGFSFGNETHLVLGHTPGRDCANNRRSITSQPLTVDQITLTTSTVVPPDSFQIATEEMTEFVTSMVTPVMPLSITAPPVADVNENWLNKPNDKKDISDEKERRNVELPVESGALSPSGGTINTYIKQAFAEWIRYTNDAERIAIYLE